jgi:hypothetical protein
VARVPCIEPAGLTSNSGALREAKSVQRKKKHARTNHTA